MEVTNPYAAPKARLEDVPVPRFYTPWQISLAAFFGTALAGGFMVSRNHALFGSPAKAKAALLWSVVVLVCAVGAAYALPGRRTGTLPAIIVAALYRWYAQEAFQKIIDERRAQGWLQYSWWRVVLVPLACIALIVVLGTVSLVLYRLMFRGRSLV